MRYRIWGISGTLSRILVGSTGSVHAVTRWNRGGPLQQLLSPPVV
jgi:hypothetical protein